MKTGILTLSERCLRNLCLQLSEHMDATGMKSYPTMDRNALLNLAMTSRIFYEPAMSTLWYTLHTIVPLFYTLPTDLCNMDKEEGRNKSSEESTGTPYIIIVCRNTHSPLFRELKTPVAFCSSTGSQRLRPLEEVLVLCQTNPGPFSG